MATTTAPINIDDDAGSGSSGKRKRKDDDTETKCAICLEPYTKPVVTSCGHVYCLECAFNLLTMSEVKCPKCVTPLSAKFKIASIPKCQRNKPDCQPGVFRATCGHYFCIKHVGRGVGGTEKVFTCPLTSCGKNTSVPFGRVFL